MTDILIDGEIYTSDRLTYWRNSDSWVACFDGEYRATGFSRDKALHDLAAFLSAEHPELWVDAKAIFDEYFSAERGE